MITVASAQAAGLYPEVLNLAVQVAGGLSTALPIAHDPEFQRLVELTRKRTSMRRFARL